LQTNHRKIHELTKEVANCWCSKPSFSRRGGGNCRTRRSGNIRVGRIESKLWFLPLAATGLQLVAFRAVSKSRIKMVLVIPPAERRPDGCIQSDEVIPQPKGLCPPCKQSSENVNGGRASSPGWTGETPVLQTCARPNYVSARASLTAV